MLCWQTYISALDEDLGKAQARMDGILSADGNSTSKQNEMLKAAAKQVCVPSPSHLCGHRAKVSLPGQLCTSNPAPLVVLLLAHLAASSLLTA